MRCYSREITEPEFTNAHRRFNKLARGQRQPDLKPLAQPGRSYRHELAHAFYSAMNHKLYSRALCLSRGDNPKARPFEPYLAGEGVVV